MSKAPSSSSQQSKSANQPVPKPFSLRELKKKYKPFNIFLFKCNKCDTGLHALHLPNCLNNQNCPSENSFQQADRLPDFKMWIECLKELTTNIDWSPKIK
jgi:hypothetical protein